MVVVCVQPCVREVDDTPTSDARRDVTAFFSPQDCINFLRFTRPQVCADRGCNQSALMLHVCVCAGERVYLKTYFLASTAPTVCVLAFSLGSTSTSLPSVVRSVPRIVIFRLPLADEPCISSEWMTVCAPVSVGFPNSPEGHALGLFGMSESRVCETFNWMLHFLDFNWGFLLSLNVDRVKPRLLEFAKAVYESGAPLAHCWGFIDGTVRGIARYVNTLQDRRRVTTSQ